MNPDGTPDASASFWGNIQQFVTGGLNTYGQIKTATATGPAANAAANTKTTIAPGTGPVPMDQKTMLIYGAAVVAVVAFFALKK